MQNLIQNIVTENRTEYLHLPRGQVLLYSQFQGSFCLGGLAILSNRRNINKIDSIFRWIFPVVSSEFWRNIHCENCWSTCFSAFPSIQKRSSDLNWTRFFIKKPLENSLYYWWNTLLCCFSDFRQKQNLRKGFLTTIRIFQTLPCVFVVEDLVNPESRASKSSKL